MFTCRQMYFYNEMQSKQGVEILQFRITNYCSIMSVFFFFLNRKEISREYEGVRTLHFHMKRNTFKLLIAPLFNFCEHSTRVHSSNRHTSPFLEALLHPVSTQRCLCGRNVLFKWKRGQVATCFFVGKKEICNMRHTADKG